MTTFTRDDLRQALADWTLIHSQYDDSEFPDLITLACIAETWFPRALAALEEAWALIGDVWERRASVEDLRLGYQVWLDNELCERFKGILRAAKERT